MGFDNPEKRMEVESLHPGITIEEVLANTGFELLVSKKLTPCSSVWRTRLLILVGAGHSFSAFQACFFYGLL
jgi:hypothetical protein